MDGGFCFVYWGISIGEKSFKIEKLENFLLAPKCFFIYLKYGFCFSLLDFGAKRVSLG